MDQGRRYDVLLLDFGGVCLLNPVEMHSIAEDRLGLERGTFDWLGPVNPDTDPLWRELTMGESLQEREYWARRAADVGAAAGLDMSLPEYMQLLYSPPTADMIRPEATNTVQRALRAGYRVSVLTNDMRAFHGAEWVTQVEFLGLVEHVIDCSDTGILKPDPRAYERAVGIVDCEPGRILFVDDQQLSVTGAEQAGLNAQWLDIANASASWAQVAATLEL